MIIREEPQVWNFMPHIARSFTTKEKQRRELIGNTIASHAENSEKVVAQTHSELSSDFCDEKRRLCNNGK